MKARSTARFFTATAAVAFLAHVTIIAGQTPPAQGAPEPVPMTQDVFKTVVMLQGIPVDTFFEAMGMFANAMGNDCTYCHDSKAYFDKAAFALPTPRLQRARQMIAMMNAINRQYFGGQPRVTCYTCHAGDQSPRSDSNLMTQYSTPVEDPNIRDFPTDARITAEKVFARYIEALGGTARVSAWTSYTARGTYSGFDTGLSKVPVEIFGRAPAQQTMVVQLSIGTSTRVFDGRNGWMAGPDTPVPLVTLTEGNLDRARLEAMVGFPVNLQTAYPQWRGGRTAIDDKEVTILQGSAAGQPVANLYFDETGLLVRLVRWTRTPVGFVPTQVDYSDYRDVAGVKVPFKRVVSQTYMQMTVEITELRPNVAVEASRFARPAPVAAPAG